MKKLVYILILVLISCSSVDKRYFRNPIKKNAEIITTQQQTENNKFILYDKRSLDTTIIYLNTIQKPTLKNKFDEALQNVEKGNYQKAHNELKVIYESIEPDNDLYNIVIYYLAECELYLNKIDDAEKKFIMIIENNDNHEAIIERSLIRLGQIYCLRKQNEKAQQYFNKLKEHYPESLYLKFANCSEN